jgi:predicted aspartyl protease
MAAFVLLAAAGAGHAQPPAPAGGPDCKVVLQARLPISESHGRFVVPVSLDDMTLPMMVDTGAQRAALSPQAADRLNLATDASRTFSADDIGGRSPGAHPRIVNVVRFGPVVWPRYAMQPVNILRPEQQGDPGAPAGVIGADMLSAYDVEFDFPGRSMALYSVSGCSGDFVPWPGRHDILAAGPAPADLMVIPVTINGRRIKALLDTGSNTSSLSLDVARLSGVTPDALKQDPPSSYVSSRGALVGAHRHRFVSFAVGAATYRNPELSVQDVNFSVFDMLLGMDYLRGRRLWLSYGTHQVFIQLIRSAPPPPAAARPPP